MQAPRRLEILLLNANLNYSLGVLDFMYLFFCSFVLSFQLRINDLLVIREKSGSLWTLIFPA
jgi:hypothetical protein